MTATSTIMARCAVFLLLFSPSWLSLIVNKSMRAAEACQICLRTVGGRFLPSSRPRTSLPPLFVTDDFDQAQGERWDEMTRTAGAVDFLEPRAFRKQPETHWFVQLSAASEEEEESESDPPERKEDATKEQQQTDGMSMAMIACLGFYKKVISPLLPPACRFVPTCSQYGVQAIQEFGPTKGVILTAWRLMRCSPIGGKGYDPPKWPPVHFTYSSY